MNSQVLKSKVKISFLGLVVMLFGFGLTMNAAEYVVDKTASKVKWEAKKVTGKHDGSISFANGSITGTGNNISAGTFVIDMKSMTNDDVTDAGMKAKLMGHLASDDFFSIEKFPESKMVIKKVTAVAGDEFKFLVDLTIKGITNPVEFNAKVTATGDKLAAEGVITVNRTLYGIKYGSGSFFQGLGDKVIYDDFTLAFSVVAQKK
ncbi:MAG: YceI family protein [Mariniphaga sp.]|nr:YceI family protein [Mariniphaga sp.]